MNLKLTFAPLFLLVLMNTTTALASPITINWSSVKSVVLDGAIPGGFVEETYLGTTYTSTEITAVQGDSRATTTTDWQDFGSSAVFDFSLEQQRAGAEGSYAVSFERSLFFTANQDTSYALEGFYALTGAGAVYSDISLLDRTTGFEMTLFQDISYSLNTLDEVFVLGDIGDGDTANTNVGSLTGILIAGRSYKFTSTQSIQLLDGPDSGATALGNLSLTVGTVPEPESLAIFAVGLAVLGFRRRKETIKKP